MFVAPARLRAGASVRYTLDSAVRLTTITLLHARFVNVGLRPHAVRRFVCLGFSGAAWILTSACAVIHRPPTTVALLQGEVAAARAAERARVDTAIERLARRLNARGDHTADILLLSGGGQHGAYGAGFLRGWRDAPSGASPTFDIITGISTGGLQSPFALLGTPAALDTLSTLYRDAVGRTAPGFDWFFWLRKTGGLAKTKKLDHTIETVVDATMAAQLRAEFARDRQLWVGTTDMDLGMPRSWDMSQVLADTGGERLAHRVFRATAAIPGVFSPVILEKHVHADGGVISNVLPLFALEDFRRLAERRRALGDTATTTVRVWLILNLFVDPPLKVVTPSSVGGMGGRGTALLFYGQQGQLIERMETLARAVTAGVPGVRLEFRASVIDASLATAPGAQKLFDRAWMRRLELIGYERARSATPWDVVVK